MTASIADICLAHRYLYYVKCTPVISDQQYDELEAQACSLAPAGHDIHLPGSSLENDYTDETKARAQELLDDAGLL